jgi:iron complex outermembrane receptor protein
MSFQKTAIFMASVSLLAPVGRAAAPNATPEVNQALPDVRVYASRFEEKINDAMPQVMVITAADIQRSGANNVSEILSKVAGLATRINLDGSTNAVIDMRGYGDTADNNVVVLLDGVRLSEAEQTAARTSMIPVEAIDHIEITKTGNSVLYGDGATGGTINIVTKKNMGNMTVLSGGIASYSGYQSGVYHSRQLEDSDLSLFAKQYASKNYRENSKGAEYSAGMQWIKHLDAQADLGFRFFSSKEKNKLPGALPSIYLNSSPRSTQVPDYNYDADVNATSFTLFGNKKFGNVEFSVDLSKRIRDNTDIYSYDAYDVYTGYHKSYWRRSFANSSSHSDVESFSPRLKIDEFLIKNNKLQFGYDRSRSKKTGAAYKSDAFYDQNPWTNMIDNSSYGFTHHTDAIYLRDVWDVSSIHQFVLGYRRQSFTQDYTGYYFNDNDPTINPSASLYKSEGKVSANEVQYNAKINSELTSYLRWSNNFRIANADDNAAANGVYVNPNWYPTPLKPQTSKDIDVGFAYKTGTQTLMLNYFDSKINHEIGYDPTQSVNVNYEPTKRNGLNFHGRQALVGSTELRLNLQYTEAKFSEGAFANKFVPGVAPLSGNFSIGLKLLSQGVISATTRFANAKYMSGDFKNTQPKTPGYMVEDLSYFYKQSNWSVVTTLGNVFNKSYTDTGIYRATYTSPYDLTLYPNPGRTVSVTGRYIF